MGVFSFFIHLAKKSCHFFGKKVAKFDFAERIVVSEIRIAPLAPQNRQGHERWCLSRHSLFSFRHEYSAFATLDYLKGLFFGFQNEQPVLAFGLGGGCESEGSRRWKNTKQHLLACAWVKPKGF